MGFFKESVLSRVRCTPHNWVMSGDVRFPGDQGSRNRVERGLLRTSRWSVVLDGDIVSALLFVAKTCAGTGFWIHGERVVSSICRSCVNW